MTSDETDTDTALTDVRAKAGDASTPVLDIEYSEKQRMVSLSKEREAAKTIFRNNSKYLNLARQKAQQREDGREEKVR